MSGQTSYQAGLAAEQAVAAQYIGRGYRLLHHRWRSKGGEIDLIFEHAEGCVFVEVKQSRTFDRAAESLGQAQVARLFDGAAAFLAARPDGALTEARFDVALVNQLGEIRILENALCA